MLRSGRSAAHLPAAVAAIWESAVSAAPEQDQQTRADWQPASFETPAPNIARVYDYLLGGKDNYAPDRQLAQRIEQTLPEVHLGVKAQRAVLRRVVRYLVGEAGLRQLLDIGSGLPTADNVHQIARALEPDTRVVYVDNDPVVLAHARALLADNRETVVVAGDLRQPASLLADQRLRAHLDFGQPVGLLLCGILHYVLDEEEPPGSCASWSTRCRPAVTSSSTTCCPPATTPRPPPPRRCCARAWAGRSSVPWHRSARSSTAWSWSIPGWSRSPSGTPRPTPRSSARTRCCGWRRSAWRASPERSRAAEGRRLGRHRVAVSITKR